MAHRLRCRLLALRPSRLELSAVLRAVGSLEPDNLPGFVDEERDDRCVLRIADFAAMRVQEVT